MPKGIFERKPFTREHKENLSKNHGKWNKGQHLSEEHRQKISEANKGKKRPDLLGNQLAKGNTAWNKGKEWSEETRKKLSGSNHVGWKGKDVSYSALHHWIRKYKGKANEQKCIFCPKQAMDWANVNHKYRRNLDDYISLCRKCHIKFDKYAL